VWHLKGGEELSCAEALKSSEDLSWQQLAFAGSLFFISHFICRMVLEHMSSLFNPLLFELIYLDCYMNSVFIVLGIFVSVGFYQNKSVKYDL
jgi:hypothetical protein